MRSVLLLLSLLAASTAAGQTTCTDALPRVVDESGKLRPRINGADVFALSTCASTASVASAFDEAVANFDYAPEADVKKDAQPCERCEWFVRMADLPAEVRKELMQTYKPSRAPAAASGGSPNIPGQYLLTRFVRHANKRGHYHLTRLGAERYGAVTTEYFSDEALQLIQDASRDADFFEWTNPSAHAQTRNRADNGRLATSSEQAQQQFVQWSAEHVRAAVRHCREGDPRKALYRIGYALHGVQDLAFHNGISNAEHSWRDYASPFDQETGVDTSHLFDHKWELAIRSTEQFLRNSRAKLVRENQARCWQRMIELNARPLDDSEKTRVLGKAAEMTVTELVKYRALAEVVRLHFDVKEKERHLARRWLTGPAGDFDVDRLEQVVASIFSR